MDIICEENKCTGCMACSAICGHQAIIPSHDDLGFLRPQIIHDRCVDCGLCLKVCPANVEPIRYPSINCYAAVTNNFKLLKDTASGGICSSITYRFIEQGGVVYGCTGEDIRNTRHIRISEASDVYKLQGSKYVQSSIMDAYHSVRNDLRKGINVLFIGVSCQIAGIKKFLIKDYPNLYTVDLICHGVASQNMLNDDLDYYQNKYKLTSIKDVRFRRKTISPQKQLKVEYGMYFNANNKDFSFKGVKDPFILSYTNDQLFRSSCYECSYANLKRVSDLTLGDFWGLSADAGLSDKLGVSVCISHTDKGEFLINQIKSETIIVPRDISEAVKGNPQLIKPTLIPASLQRFRRLYLRKGLVKASRIINRRQLLKSKIYHWVSEFGMLHAAHSIRKLCRI